VRGAAREEPAHKVHHRLQIVDCGDRLVGSALRIDQVGAHESDSVAELRLGALALGVHDPGERAVVVRIEQLADDRATQSAGATGHEHTHDPAG
jgi:hypothetical protein